MFWLPKLGFIFVPAIAALEFISASTITLSCIFAELIASFAILELVTAPSAIRVPVIALPAILSVLTAPSAIFAVVIASSAILDVVISLAPILELVTEAAANSLPVTAPEAISP